MPNSAALYFDPNSFHDSIVGDRRILFHLPSSSLFELDQVAGEVLDFVKTMSSLTQADVLDWISTSRAPGQPLTPAQVAETIHDFLALKILGSRAAAPSPEPVKVENFPLTTLVLSVSNGCNLSCSYCYKEDLQQAGKATRMDFETARRGIELLIAEGAPHARLSVAFLGGEPLSNPAMIRQVVTYAEKRCAEEGKAVDFTLTTNATMLTEDSVRYFDEHRFGISVSMDGPQAIHDRHRKTVAGDGTYERVAGKARMLLSRYRSRPVGARVTLAAGTSDVVGIYRHLKDEIGFFEVGFAPVTTSPQNASNLSAAELGAVFAGMKELGKEYLSAALDGRHFGFSNMHQLLGDLNEGRSKSLPCGAGIGLLALDAAGDLHLCHRFAGSMLQTFGNVTDGIAKDRLGGFLEAAADLSGRPCASCRIRSLCAGGCYHESYVRFEDPLTPTYHYCELMREWVDFGVSVYVELLERNPSFLAQHLESRRNPQ
jgi:uncharacterized protein